MWKEDKTSAMRPWTRTGAASCSNRIRRVFQDRNGGEPLLRASRDIFPFIQRVFADSGYAGEKVTTATLIAVEIVRKNPDQSASPSTRDVGSSSGSSRGSGAIDGWQKTSRLPSTPPALSSTPHPSCCSCVGSLVLHDFRNRQLDCDFLR